MLKVNISANSAQGCFVLLSVKEIIVTMCTAETRRGMAAASLEGGRFPVAAIFNTTEIHKQFLP